MSATLQVTKRNSNHMYVWLSISPFLSVERGWDGWTYGPAGVWKLPPCSTGQYPLQGHINISSIRVRDTLPKCCWIPFD